MGVFNIVGMGRIIYAVLYIYILAMSGSQAPRFSHWGWDYANFGRFPA